MRVWTTFAALLVAGCGRPLLGDLDGGGGTAAASSGSEGDGADDGDGDGGTAAEGPADEGLDDTPQPDDDGPMDGGEDGPVPPPLDCFNVFPLFDAEGDVPVLALDQDSDGVDELWAINDTGGGGPGGGPPETTVYGISGTGEVLSETFVAGRVFSIDDADGNGYRDLLVAQFGGGGPPQLLFLLSEGPATFTGGELPMELNFGTPIAGLFDATGDGIMDVLYHQSEALLEVHMGDGFGNFIPMGAFEFPAPGLQAFPLEGAIAGEGFIGVREVPPMMGPPPPCQLSPYTTLGLVEGQPWYHASTEGAPFGPPWRSITGLDGYTLIYTDACDPGSDTHGAVLLASPPDAPAQYLEYPLVEGMGWIGIVDFDGGYPDLMFAELGSEEVFWARGLDPVSIETPEAVPTLDAIDVVPDRLIPADFEGLGFESLVRAVVAESGDPPLLTYERVQLGPCPD